MMNINYRLKQKFTNIADAIRSGLSSSELMTVDEMPPNIEDISTQANALEDSLLTRNLTTYHNARITELGASALRQASQLTDLDLPNVRILRLTSISGCTSLVNINIPNVETTGTGVFEGCTAIARINMPKASTIAGSTFNRCNTLALLDLYDPDRTTIPTLSNVNALANTLIASGQGYIKINDELVDETKAANNWSTYADQIIGNTEADELGL